MTTLTNKKQITWTGKTGKTATVTIELVTDRTYYTDGDNVTIPCCELLITGSITGMGVVGYSVSRIDSPHAAGRCGGLGIPEEQMVLIEAAIAEAEATPSYQAKLAREQQARREAAEYETSTRRMQCAMSGGTY